MARELGVETLAEGVETDAEKNLCDQLGFDLAQGYAYAEPKPVDQL
jgi:EAL domain-containing protein (putative c-di-GMP-specific phosphodiesterase class I)